MFKSKKGRMMRHPYATLTLFSLAAAGVISLTQKGKQLVMEKSQCVKNMMNKWKTE